MKSHYEFSIYVNLFVRRQKGRLQSEAMLTLFICMVFVTKRDRAENLQKVQVRNFN